MAIALSSAGITVSYAVEATAGTRPTTAASFTKIPEIKSLPDLNPEPSVLDSTTFDNLEFRSYIQGLKDLGGAIAFTANMNDTFQTAWEGLVTAAETGKASDKATWFCVQIPNLTKTFYFAGEPSPLGMSAQDVGSVVEIQAYVVPNKVEGWAAAPTT